MIETLWLKCSPRQQVWGSVGNWLHEAVTCGFSLNVQTQIFGLLNRSPWNLAHTLPGSQSKNLCTNCFHITWARILKTHFWYWQKAADFIKLHENWCTLPPCDRDPSVLFSVFPFRLATIHLQSLRYRGPFFAQIATNHDLPQNRHFRPYSWPRFSSLVAIKSASL